MEISSLTYKFGEFILDIDKGCLFKDGAEVRLRPKVYETLKYLVQHPGRLISKQELMQAIWADAFVTDDLLVQCTLELRRALGDHGQRLLGPFRGADICSARLRLRNQFRPGKTNRIHLK